MLPMRVRLFAVAALALFAVGCGGTSSSSSSGSGGGLGSASGLAPPDAIAFAALDTDLSSSQVKTAQALLDKFPGHTTLLQKIQTSLTSKNVSWETDVKPALGPELDVAIAKNPSGGATTGVGYTQPKDKAKFKALVAKLDASSPGGKPTIITEVNGWTLFSNNQQLLDQAKTAADGAGLDKDKTFSEAWGKLPGDALAKVYVAGSQLQSALGSKTGGAIQGNIRYVYADVVSQADGMKLEGHAISSGGTQSFAPQSSELVKQVPSGTLLFFDFHGSKDATTQLNNPALKSIPQLGAITAALQQLGPLFQKEVAIYVRQGTPIPEVTLVSQVDNEAQAKQSVTAMIAQFAPLLGQKATSQATTVGGVAAQKLNLGSFAIYTAVFDGKLVVTSAPGGITGLKGGGAKLADDAAFKSAAKSAGMPDATTGFAYVNVKDSVPLIDGIAQLAGKPLPAQVRANLEPVRSFLMFASAAKDDAAFGAFLQVQ